MARILYVEDSIDYRMGYASAFEAAGHEVTACANYFVARQILETESHKNFDLIVTDGRYPGDRRFGGRSEREGSLSLLSDLQRMGATLPVAILSTNPRPFKPGKLPEGCATPVAYYRKSRTSFAAMAAEVPKLLQARPG